VFPALALAVEPSAEDAMQQPPRDPKQRLVTPAMVGLIVWQGMMLAAVTLVAFMVGMRWYGIAEEGLDHTVTMAFMTLALAQVFHAFNARSERRSALHGLSANKWLWAATCVCVLLQLAAVYVPLLQRVLRTTALAPADWGVVLVCSLAPIMIVETSKLARRVLGSRADRGRGEVAKTA
jgi:Ca2+-transporting ATPase